MKVSLGRFESVAIPLPPLAEQHADPCRKWSGD